MMVTFRKYQVYFILIGFLLINLALNRQIVLEVFGGEGYRTLGGDDISYQYFAESFYQNLLRFKNPFEHNQKILFPFGTHTVFQDLGPIHTIYFIFLRPFFSIYQSILISLLISIFLAEVFSYLLLRHLKISVGTSILFALVFSFSPIMVWRLHGHFAYIHFFVFPLIALLFLRLWEGSKNLIVTASFLGLGVGLLPYTTLYYLVMFVLFILAFAPSFILCNWQERESILDKFFLKAKYFFLAFCWSVFFLLPMILAGMNSLLSEGVPKRAGWAGADVYSATVYSMFVPSPYNYFFHGFLRDFFYLLQPLEGTMYPGLLVLTGVLIYFRRRYQRSLLPLLITGIFFWILSFGPYLSMIRFWDDYSTIKMPLPFQLLQEIPLVSMFRSPIRFAVPFVFCAMIIAAISVDKDIKGSTRKILVYIVLFLIFVVDQVYLLDIQPRNIVLPEKSYKYIKNSGTEGVVLEVPFVIQDGEFFRGEDGYRDFEIGQLVHNKPVVGGFLGIINKERFQYYLSDPLISYGLSLMEPKVREKFNQEINFFSTKEIEYILIRKDRINIEKIKKELSFFNFYLKDDNDNGFLFFERR